VLGAVVLTVAGIAFRFWWDYRRVCQLEADAVAVGGSVEATYWGPEWLKKWVGNHRDFQMGIDLMTTKVIFVGIYEEVIDDSWTSRLAAFRDLEYLNLTNSRVTDSGLLALERLPKLQSLSLEGTAITDAGLEILARFPALTYVNVKRTQVTTQGIIRLQDRHPELRVLFY
jgi:hypothetical protein